MVAGLGGYLPPHVVTNKMLAEQLDTSDEWIYSRTGIRQRHVVSAGMATSDLAVEAGRRALASAAATGTATATATANMVILATTTPDYPCPASAPDIAFRLGLGPVPAFDVSAVCAGFVYALGVGAGAISAGLAERVLVIGAEAFTSIIDPRDRTTAPIFGDGAGAVVLRAGERTEPGALLAFDLGSDGHLKDLIRVPAGGSRQRLTEAVPDPRDYYFAMQGKAVFKNAVQHMTASLQAALRSAGWGLDEIDWLVGHQANVRILQLLADQLGVRREQAVVNIDSVGNTSAASIPLMLADGTAAGTFAVGDKIALTAFGGGLAWGSVVLTWPRIELAGAPRDAVESISQPA